MRKLMKTVALLLAGTSMLGFAACGKSNLSKEDEEFVSSGGTIVRFYSFNDTETNKQLQEALEKDFYVKNPKIKINCEISTGSFYTNLLNDFTGKIEADVFGMEPGEIYPFLHADYLEPLDGYFEASSEVSLDDVWEINQKAYAYDNATGEFGSGKTYAVMKDWTTDSMLLYNRALFSQEQLQMIEKDKDGDGDIDPLTFEEFKTLATSLVKKNGNFITQYGFLPGLAEAKVLSQFLTNAGQSWFDPANGYNSTLNNADVQETVKLYYDVLGANEVNEVSGTPYPQFAAGKVAMVMGGLYCLNAYNLEDMDLGVAYPPVKDNNTESKPITTGCVGFAISKRSKVKDAAFKFIEWYLQYYAKIDGAKCSNFPALKSAAQDYTLNPEVNTNAAKLAIAQKFYNSLDKAVVIERNPYCSQMSFENIEFTYTGEYLQGELTFKEYCDILSGEINKVVKQSKPRS